MPLTPPAPGDIDVLVVADREDLREFLTGALQAGGFRMRSVVSALDAVEHVGRFPPDVVVLGVLEGAFECIQAIRSTPVCGDVPVLMITEDGEVPDPERSAQLHLDDFLVRPFRAEEFLSRITTLGRSRTYRDRLRHTRKRHKDELELARAVQANLLPDPLPSRRGVRIACCYRPTEELSGDFYDVIDLGQDATGFFVADVVGHGVSAALFTSFLKAQLLHWSLIMQKETPSETLNDMNQALCKVFHGSGRFVTAVYATFEPGIERLHFANAGHPAPLYLPHEGEAYFLDGAELPIGISVKVEYVTREIRFASKDRVVFYTDGLHEQRWHGKGEQFGKRRLADLLIASRTEPLEVAVRKVWQALEEWRGPSLQADDVNIVAIESAGP